jgi:hypothetical protein
LRRPGVPGEPKAKKRRRRNAKPTHDSAP